MAILSDATEMKSKAHIPLCDAIRFYQQKRGVFIARACLRRRLCWEQLERLPMEGDSIQLSRALTDTAAREPSIVLRFTVTGDEHLKTYGDPSPNFGEGPLNGS